MKILAINTDPLKERGKIRELVDPFLAGLKDSGAEVELYYSLDLLIFPCCGNLNCTIETPGKCMAWDDMRWLRQKIGEADVLVLASPLYYNGFTGREGVTESLKQLLERLSFEADVPRETPYEHAIHTIREAVSLRKVVIVSGSGFWEIDDFYPVLTHLKALCHNTFPELAGCITSPLRTSALCLLPDEAFEKDIVRLARESGIRLAGEVRQITPHVRAARDGGEAAAPANEGRVWESVTLFQFTTM